MFCKVCCSNVPLGVFYCLPRTVALTFYVSQVRYAKLSRLNHNHESYKCRIYVSRILFTSHNLTVREIRWYQSRTRPILIISSSSSCFTAAFIDVSELNLTVGCLWLFDERRRALAVCLLVVAVYGYLQTAIAVVIYTSTCA